jgi:methionyl-tRNA synthetase
MARLTASKDRFLVTAALPYANGPLHIGHLAGAYLPADIYVRYLRLLGKDVVFVCGSDEHGAAITVKARKEHTTPKAIVDKYHSMLRDTFKDIGISFDIYHRTSEALHHQTSQDFFRKLLEKGSFSEETTMQYYDPEARQFLADRYITGTCPICNNPDAYGDQCEKCGAALSPNDLKDPRSLLSGAKPEKKSTTHWFLRLDQEEPWLREWINKGTVNHQTLHNPHDWKNHVIGQCNAWLEQGLQPRAMTRDLDWGVDVPPEIPGSTGKKLYVWLDAPIGYISATKQWAEDTGNNWETYWKDDRTALIHFIGKDNIVFHCLIFPAILKAHGEFVLPVNVPANQFMNLEGKKLSTSKNWAVWVHEFVADFPGKEDTLRYNMAKNMPEQKDSEFTWKAYQESTNAELVNNLANFVHRVLVLTHKYYGGLVPEATPGQPIKSGWDPSAETSLKDDLYRLHNHLQAAGAEIERFNFREALRILMEVSGTGNALLQFNEPWKQVNDHPERVKAVIQLAIQYVAALSVALQPYLPFTSSRLRNMLMLPEALADGAWQHMLDTLAGGALLVPSHHAIGAAEHLFERVTDETIQAQIDKLLHMEQQTPAASLQKPAFQPLADAIQFDDFTKLDIRTGRVLAAESVPKSKKLLKLQIDLGFEVRTILSGIAEYFSPQDVLGREVVVLANLAPRTIMGISSQGMVLMAEDTNGKLGFVQPDANWPPGSTVK